MGIWFILFHAGTFSFQNCLIAKKMVENVSAPIVKNNANAMPLPPETPSLGSADTPNEATRLVAYVAYRERKGQSKKNVFQLIP